MSKIYQKTIGTAIALSSLLAGIYSLPLNAQGNITKDGSSLENIEADENLNWGFTSEDESISVQDDLRELETYSISDEDDGTNLRLTEENSRWGNRGDVDDYTFDVEVYDY
jgi:hypothetical protein